MGCKVQITKAEDEYYPTIEVEGQIIPTRAFNLKWDVENIPVLQLEVFAYKLMEIELDANVNILPTPTEKSESTKITHKSQITGNIDTIDTLTED